MLRKPPTEKTENESERKFWELTVCIMLQIKDAHDAIATFIEPIMLQN